MVLALLPMGFAACGGDDDDADNNSNANEGGGGEIVSNTTCPDGNHPHLIDLGLPSGTKWACCNIGAITPEGYGEYYRWAETTPFKEGGY